MAKGLACSGLLGCSGGVMPETLPTLTDEHVRLRGFITDDVALVQSVAADPLIPLITTVPTTGTREDAHAYIARQDDRLMTRAGYSFAIVY